LTVEVISKVSINGILPNPWQPQSRINIDMLTAKRFADSIKEHGLLQIPVCRKNKDGRLEMGDGWLRLAGYRWLANNRVPGYDMMDVIVKDLTDKQMADLVMEANNVRQDLNPVELAEFYRKYLDSFEITQEELGKLHNVSQGEISNTLRLLDLPVEVQRRVISQEISPTHGRILLQLKDKKVMVELAAKIHDRNWSVADLDRAIKDILKPPAQAPLEPPKEHTRLNVNKESGEIKEPVTLAGSHTKKGTDETNTKAATPDCWDDDDDCDECMYKELDDCTGHKFEAATEKTEDKPLEKISVAELKAQAASKKKLRKVILTELPDGVRVAIGPEGAIPFIKTVACELEGVPLRMLLEEAGK